MGMCCPGLKPPKGPEWEAAEAGFKILQDEATSIIMKTKNCCFDPFKVKAALDADWTVRANAELAKNGLAVTVHAFYTSDGKSAHPHLVLQFSKVKK